MCTLWMKFDDDTSLLTDDTSTFCSIENYTHLFISLTDFLILVCSAGSFAFFWNGKFGDIHLVQTIQISGFSWLVYSLQIFLEAGTFKKPNIT